MQQKYRIISTGIVFPQNEIQSHFQNVSFVFPLDQDILDHFGLELVDPSVEDLAAELTYVKFQKNQEINMWRATANQSYFTHGGKQIACDSLSRSDIDAVAGSVSLTNAFPAGFPNAWKALDNTYVSLPDVDSFKAMYASMTLQGTINFGRAQTLKTALAAAITVEQVNAITWY